MATSASPRQDTVTSRFRDMISERPEGTALRWKEGDEWRSMTWQEYGDGACRVAGGLQRLGVERGARVLLMLRNRPEFHVLDLGVLLAGATPVSVYNSCSPEQLQYLGEHMGATVAVVDGPDFLDRLLKVRPELPGLEHVLVVDDPDGVLPGDVARYAQLLEADPVDLDEAADAVQPDDLLTVIYTSGTTGNPKGVQLTHTNAVYEADTMYEHVVAEDSTGWQTVSYLPMAHIAERVASHYAGPLAGLDVACCPDPSELATYVKEIKPQTLFGPPRVWEKMKAGVEGAVAAQGEERLAGFRKALEVGGQVDELRRAGQELPDELASAYEKVEAEALAPLRQMLGLHQAHWLLTGAAPIPLDVVQFYRALGLPFSECWGMSETTGALTWSHHDFKPGSVGKVVPGCELKIADDGELLVKGPNVMPGYLGDEEKTAEAFDSDGWFRTGDVATISDDGYLYLRDRKKELIITAGGKNVSPANIEAALKSISLVGQACVIGDGRPYLVGLLVLDPDAAPTWAASHGKEGASLAALAEDPEVVAEVERAVDEVNEQFNNVEQIKKFTLLGEEWLPDTEVLTPTMKLKRRGVHQRYAEEIEELYARPRSAA